MIQVSKRDLIVSDEHKRINVQNDKNAEKVKICCPRYYDGIDLSQHTMYLKTISQGGRDDILLTKTTTANEITAEWTLCPPQTSYNGYLAIQLYFISATTVGTTTTVTFKWETKPSQIEIIRSEDASPVVPTTPSAYQQWLAAIQEIADEATEAKEAIEDMTATASIDANVGTPSVTVTKSTIEGHENLDFAFKNLKSTNDHTQLINKDSANQHPISAITNLQTTLDGKGTYSKPSGGIPSSDMSSAVQTSLGKADTAIQSLSGYATETYVNNHHDSTKQNVIDSEHKLAYSLLSGTPTIPTKTSELTNDSGFLTEHQSLSAYRTSAAQDLIDATKANTADLATVATSGSYNDLSNKPSIPSALSDLTDDTTHRVVTDTEKSTWNGKASASDVAALQSLVPSQATSSNQLADKNFVNSSIATETAHYISNNGEPFISVAQLEAYSGTVTNNDYAFVTGTDEYGNTYYDRYKATVSGSTVTWAKEYRLNNSSFTAAQWSAISSGITSGKVSTYDGYASQIADKVDKISGKGLSTNDYDNTEKGKVATALQPSDILGKADKVTNAVGGNFAGLDSNGNLTDSGKKASDFITEHQSLAAYRTSANQDIVDNTKANKIANATNGNVATVDSNGQYTDSGIASVSVLLSNADTTSRIISVTQKIPLGYRLGGKIFYIDSTASGAKYTFYNRDGSIITDVQVGDEPYMYSVEGTPVKDKYYVFNSSAVLSKTWTYKLDGSWVYNSLGTQDGIGKGKNNTAIVVVADSGAYVSYANTIWNSLSALNIAVDKGCNDWFVPSKAELEALRIATDRNGNALTTLFTNTHIWGSFEHSSPYVWRWNFINQSWDYVYKTNGLALVATRSF